MLDLRLLGAAAATTASFTSVAAYSCTGRSRSTTALMAAPRAWPSFRAESGLRAMKTFSMATFVRLPGRDGLAQAVQQAAQPLRKIVRAQQHQRRMVDMRDLACAIDIDDADAGALRAGVDAEDAGHSVSPIDSAGSTF